MSLEKSDPCGRVGTCLKASERSHDVRLASRHSTLSQPGVSARQAKGKLWPLVDICPSFEMSYLQLLMLGELGKLPLGVDVGVISY